MMRPARVTDRVNVTAKNVNSYIYALSDMNHDGEQFVQSIRVLGVVDGVKQPELQGKCHSICQLRILPNVLLVFETLKVQREDVG